MKKKFFALSAALITAISALGASGCDISDTKPSASVGGSSSTSSAKTPSGSTANSSETSSDQSSDADGYSSSPQIIKCGDITAADGKRTFDSEITCGNAVTVTYHYTEGADGKLENAIPTFRPIGMTSFREILADPTIVGSDSSLTTMDFKYENGAYTMNADKAKELLGPLAEKYTFSEYWKNQKMAEIVSTEKISVEEAYSKAEELFNAMSGLGT